VSFSGIDGVPGIPVQVLSYLKSHNGRFTPAREIKESLNTTRQRVIDSITYLKGAGYEIEVVADRGFRLIDAPDTILPVEVAAGLTCRRFGCRIFSYHRIGSTNAAAHDFAMAGLPEGTLVIADSQTRGRGRMGRRWHSPPAKGLYFSIILRPQLPPNKTPGLSLIAGLAVVRAIYTTAGLKTAMKWPNDVLHKGKKLAGILIELEAELDRVEYVIVGVGVNVNQVKKDFTRPLLRTAASLKLISKKDRR